MEQIAVYIIIIVILIVTSIRKGKKQQQARLEQLQKQQQAQEQQSANQLHPLDEIIKQFGGDFFENITEQQEPVAAEYYSEKKSVPSPFLDVELKRSSSRRTSREKDRLQFQNQKENEIIAEEPSHFNGVPEYFENELTTIDELRKAIIYSEIINRKYS